MDRCIEKIADPDWVDQTLELLDERLSELDTGEAAVARLAIASRLVTQAAYDLASMQHLSDMVSLVELGLSLERASRRIEFRSRAQLRVI